MSFDGGCYGRFDITPSTAVLGLQGRTVAAATFPRLSAQVFLLDA